MSGKSRARVNNPMYGRKHSEKTTKLLSEQKKGDRNPIWKGDKASQGAGQSRARSIYHPPEGYEIHHIDGNDLNNDPQNIKFITRKEHMILDERMKFLIKRNKQGKGRKASAETRVRLSISHQGSKNVMWDKKHTEESKEKMRNAQKGERNFMWGKKHKPETIEKMRAHSLIRERDEKGRFK